MPCIRITLPDNQGEITHVLAGERITIGRRADNTIQIIDPTISAHHAELIATNGHYRLHDLGSTNYTFVEGEPVADYHLHGVCRVAFGTVECEYSPEAPQSVEHKAELVPTRAELEFLRQENFDLLKKMAAVQKQVDILSSARLVTKETTHINVAPEALRRTAHERDELRMENDHLQLQIRGLKDDLVAITRERDAMRNAWETVRAELVVRTGPWATSSPPASVKPGPAVTARPAKSASDTQRIVVATCLSESRKMGASTVSDDHRAMAAVLVRAPNLLKAIRSTLEAQSGENPERIARAVQDDVEALAACLAPVVGHPVQCIVGAIEALVHEGGAAFATGTLRTLNQAIDLAGGLLDPRHLKRVKDLAAPRALIVDDDRDLLSTVEAALSLVEIRTTQCLNAADALDKLGGSPFDLVLLDIGLPGLNGIDVCGRIRELPEHKQTPIVFLTIGDTVENRAQSSLNGGNDFIVKPFNVRELALKAVTWAYRRQFGLAA
jgi:CheY-like chemotaxis protein